MLSEVCDSVARGCCVLVDRVSCKSLPASVTHLGVNYARALCDEGAGIAEFALPGFAKRVINLSRAFTVREQGFSIRLVVGWANSGANG